MTAYVSHAPALFPPPHLAMNPGGPPYSQSQEAGPFGYAFSYHPEPPAESTLIPSTGPSLLNSHEDDYINNFFIAQSQPDMSNHDFSLALQHAQHQLHGANMTQFGWLMNEPPPNFINAAATPKQSPAQPSYGQTISHQSNYDFGAFGDASGLLGGNIPEHMLNQASMMHHISPAQPHQLHTPSLVSAPSTEASDLIHTADALPNLAVSSAPLMIMPPTNLTAHDQHNMMTAHPSMGSLASLDTMQDMHLEGPHTAPARTEGAADTRLYRFGSDAHFSHEGFRPNSVNESHHIVEDRLTSELRMLKPINRSNNPTRVSSPHRQSLHGIKRDSGHLEVQQAHVSDDSDHSNKPKKRRKESADGVDASIADAKRKFAVPNPRMRRISNPSPSNSTKHRRHPSISGSAAGGAGGATAAASGKVPRENLSEEQKRSNHIQSEQKRRNLIKVGFEELRVIVPELRVGGLSKSMELSEVSNFLEQVIQANRAMRQRLGLPEPDREEEAAAIKGAAF